MKKKKKLFHVWHARKAICRKCSFKLFLLSFLSYVGTYSLTQCFIRFLSNFSFLVFTYSLLSIFSYLPTYIFTSLPSTQTFSSILYCYAGRDVGGLQPPLSALLNLNLRDKNLSKRMFFVVIIAVAPQ
jgi:hypothetical protein